LASDVMLDLGDGCQFERESSSVLEEECASVLERPAEVVITEERARILLHPLEEIVLEVVDSGFELITQSG
jgi:hypothetical protein